MLKIRRPLGRLIFNMGIATPGKTVFLIETAPRTLSRSSLLLSLSATGEWSVILRKCPIFELISTKMIAFEYHLPCTVYPKKYAHGLCFAVLCCGYTLTDFPISIRLTSLALWQSIDCPSASKATLMNMDKYFMWIHYERLRYHNKAKHNKTVCIFLGIYCIVVPCTICIWQYASSFTFEPMCECLSFLILPAKCSIPTVVCGADTLK